MKNEPSVEAKMRIERLLALRRGDPSEQNRIEKAVRILEYSESPEARKCLEELARGAEGGRATGLAKAARKRLEAVRK